MSLSCLYTASVAGQLPNVETVITSAVFFAGNEFTRIGQ